MMAELFQKLLSKESAQSEPVGVEVEEEGEDNCFTLTQNTSGEHADATYTESTQVNKIKTFSFMVANNLPLS